MWRIGPGFSPSRARRAAVSGSSGMPSTPVAISDWLAPARRYIAWMVRTWRSSPEWLLAMTAISGGSIEGIDPTGFDQGDDTMA